MRLIDAIALISKARRMETTDNNGIPVDTFAVPVMAIEDAPTVDAVEVVHGWWIIGTGENALLRGYRMCSVCGEIIKTQYSLYGMFNYCHNCGAKMDGEL